MLNIGVELQNAFMNRYINSDNNKYLWKSVNGVHVHEDVGEDIDLEAFEVGEVVVVVTGQ